MRTFIAIDLNEHIQRDLARLIDRLRPDCPKLNWVRAGHIHLTIQFLGEIAPEQITIVSGALATLASQCKPFDIEVSGVGTFPSTGPVRVIWVGVKDESGALHACQALCESHLIPLGFPRENRPFSAHLTIARNKTPAASADIRRALETTGNFSAGTQAVDGVTLYESTLSPNGSIYLPLSRHLFT